MLIHDLAKHSDLRVWVVGRRTDEFTPYAKRSGRVQKPCLRLLPVWQVNIRGHEHVSFVFFVVGCCTGRNHSGHNENKNRYQRDPMSPHWNSPFARGWPASGVARLPGKFGPGICLVWKSSNEREGTSTSKTASLSPTSRRHLRFQVYVYARP